MAELEEVSDSTESLYVKEIFKGCTEKDSSIHDAYLDANTFLFCGILIRKETATNETSFHSIDCSHQEFESEQNLCRCSHFGKCENVVSFLADFSWDTEMLPNIRLVFGTVTSRKSTWFDLRIKEQIEGLLLTPSRAGDYMRRLGVFRFGFKWKSAEEAASNRWMSQLCKASEPYIIPHLGFSAPHKAINSRQQLTRYDIRIY